MERKLTLIKLRGAPPCVEILRSRMLNALAHDGVGVGSV